KLLGLHFDNLNPSSTVTNPLISISTDSNDIPLLLINDFKLDMVDTTTYTNGISSGAFAVTTSETATFKAVKKRTYAQPTSPHPSSGRPPKIFDIYFATAYEAQIPRAFLPPAVDVCSRKATNSLKQESYEVKVLKYDMKQNMQRAAIPDNKRDSNDIISRYGSPHNKIDDQYPQIRSLNASLLDLIFGVSSYLILIHFLIQTIFSHLIWDIETQNHKHQKQMNKNNHNINLLVYLLVFSSICSIFNVSAINDITHDNGISSSTLNSTSSTPLNLSSTNKTDINSNIVSSSEFIQSSKQSNDDIQFYIRDNGIDSGSECSSTSPCKTINHILTIDSPIGFDRDSNSAIINLKSNSSDQTGIQLDSGTNLALNIIIQSEEYISNSTGYQQYSILTSSKTQSLFTITGTGHLELLGLHFDNLKTTSPSAIVPLISIQSDNNEQIPQLQISDCEFESDAPDSQIYHSIISINGGIMSLVRTKIESYKLMNGISLINIKSDKVSTVTISQTTFASIAQTGTGNGAAINAQLQQDCILKVTDSCIFYNCSTQQSSGRLGGAIYAVVNRSNSQFIVSDLVKFEKCQSRRGGAVSVELLNMGSCIVNNVQFKECIVDYEGGGIYSQLRDSGGTLTITNHTSFVYCISTIQAGGGIIIYSGGLNSNFIISDNVIFEKCETQWGGAINVQQYSGSRVDFHNVIFKDCQAQDQGGAISIGQQSAGTFDIYNVIFEKCESESGGAIYIDQRNGGSVNVHYVIFKECDAQYQGGAIYIFQRDGTSFDVHNVIFKDCEAQHEGGAIYILSGIMGVVKVPYNTTISGSTFSGSKSVNRGGAIYTELNDNSALIIENTQFESSNSNSDGGSIFAQIILGSLSLNQVIFTNCNCTQPGSGGAIAINQQNSNSRISIKESSFTNCQTLSGSSSKYGWGGAIYIQMGLEASDLSSTNFQLTDLSFTNCNAYGAGNNLHILSDDTTAVGNKIKTGNLLTVKNLTDLSNIISDLYTNDWYCFDYMGINKSKANSGNAPFTDHEPLFVSPSLTPKFKDPYIVDAEYGKDHSICGNIRLKCQTIKYLLNIGQTSVIEYPSNPATINIELQSNTQLENGIMIDSNTPIGNNFKIQSNEYTSEGTDYIKRQIQTSSKTQFLFTISNTGHLKLLGLHFDNLNPTSNSPLIQIQSENNEQIHQLQISDCEFESDAPDSQVYHSIISINGGIMSLVRTKIESYKLMNGISLINIKSDKDSTVTISQTTFTSIAQTGTGNGSVINAELNGASKLTIKEGCSFSSCSSSENGGAIYAELNFNAALTIDNGVFKDCNCTQPGNGGALCILQQTDSSKIFITDTSFTNCLTLPRSSSQRYGWGGAIYIQIIYQASLLTETNFLLTDLSFTNCTSFENIGNNLHIRSANTHNTGIAIAANSLLTVKDLTDLYTNDSYSNDYMGIDESKVNDGNTQISDHQALFLAGQLGFITKEYYIRSSDSLDENDCSSSTPCKTINYILSKSLPTEFVKGLSISIINLLSKTTDQDNIFINSETELNNIITIQPEGYISRGTEYTKQSILTSTFDSTLFTISNTGRLKLFGLHFDNLNPSSTVTNPLISISTDSNDIPLLLINDCEFNRSDNAQLYHSLIEMNGGMMFIHKTLIYNYELLSDKNLINIKQSGTSTVTISQTTFSNISQTGAGKGAVINAELYQGSILKITDSCTFYNCSTQLSDNCAGGAINAVVNGSTSQLIISDLVKFEKCQSFKGGAINVELINMGICVVNNVQFKECIVFNDGGGIFAQLQETGGILTITNHTSFDQCINTRYGGGGINIVNNGSKSKCIISDNVIFEQCEAGMGSAIYLNQEDGASFEVHDVQFIECSSRYYSGAIQYELRNGNNISSFILDGAQFIGCSSQQNGGSLLIVVQSGNATISGSTFSGSQSIGIGGALYAELNYDAALIIDNTQFNLCYSTDSDGGSIFASINSGTLSLNQVLFVGSSCSQPGSGGAIAIVQQNSNSRISIKKSSFTNCKTLTGSSSQYGWGGAIYIEMRYEASFLTLENFQLTDLSFTNCKASGAGNNLHILSYDTTAVGNQIKTGCLLTVKDSNDPTNITSDLYTNEWYCFDYMGINKSKANSGNAPFTDHEPLFVSPSLTPKFNDPYVVDAEYGKDHPICGNSRLKCQTIKYILNINKISIDDYPSNPVPINIELQSNTQLEEGILINKQTPIGNNFKFESSEYTSEGTDYIKRQIQTSSKTQSLFTISNTGCLKLLGLHFDNLNPTSNSPFISIQSDNNEQIPQLQINDCEFESDAPDSQIYHSIISINGGIMSLARTKIESYKLMNGISLINIKSNNVLTVTISQTTFTSIAQTGTGNGSVINAELNGASKLTIKEGCSFSSCSSSVNGGAIYAELNFNAALSIDNGIFKDCNCTQPGNGGALCILQQTDSSKIFITDSSFINCLTLPGTSNQYGWGGAVYIDIQYNPSTLTATNFQLTDLSFTNCIASGAGNNL
ncbi:MAG: hypothetical protein EZS28_017184, partial [Streblomastix strix]